jgi:hypothetical protein
MEAHFQTTFKEICKAYASFDLKAVGMNSKSWRVVSIWWMAFNTSKSLQEFILWIEESAVNGKRLKVVLVTGIESISKVTKDSSTTLLSTS